MVDSARKSQTEDSDGLIQKSVEAIKSNDEIISGTNFEEASSTEEKKTSKM